MAAVVMSPMPQREDACGGRPTCPSLNAPLEDNNKLTQQKQHHHQQAMQLQ